MAIGRSEVERVLVGASLEDPCAYKVYTGALWFPYSSFAAQVYITQVHGLG